jgi:hypothetical protein
MMNESSQRHAGLRSGRGANRLSSWLLCVAVCAAFAPGPCAAAKEKGFEIMITADAIDSPEGFRPKPDQPIHYLLFVGRQTLGEAIGGVKLPAPTIVEQAVVAELEKQGYRRAKEGGPLPQIAIMATVGDSNFAEPQIIDNPYFDPDIATYLAQVNMREVLEPRFLWQKVPHQVDALFIGSNPGQPNSYPSSNPDVREAQGLVLDAALRLLERGSPRARDREKIKALVGATKIDQAVASRTLGSVEAERLAWAAFENRYYLTLTAFDSQRQTNGGRRLLWRTTMLIDWRVDFTKALTAMLAQAGPMFGTDVAVPGIVNTADRREGRVEIGETKVVPKPEK